MPIKLIGIDLDGTFLAPDGTPSHKSLQVVKVCKEVGVRVCICTGRSLAQLAPILPFDAELDDLCVLTNGASIMNRRTKTYVLERRIDPAVVDPMIRALVEDCLSVPSRHMSVTGMFETHMLLSCANKMLLDRWNETMTYSRMLHETLDEFIEASKSDIQRIDYSVPFSDGERVLELLSPIVELDITSGDPKRLELVPKGINKGEGLSQLASFYGIAQENVMAIGDGINDDSMIQWAGLGVAMGNAVDSLKSIADVMVGSNAEDGFAEAIERFVL